MTGTPSLFTGSLRLPPEGAREDRGTRWGDLGTTATGGRGGLVATEAEGGRGGLVTGAELGRVFLERTREPSFPVSRECALAFISASLALRAS